jgi:hypothetical protein
MWISSDMEVLRIIIWFIFIIFRNSRWIWHIYLMKDVSSNRNRNFFVLMHLNFESVLLKGMIYFNLKLTFGWFHANSKIEKKWHWFIRSYIRLILKYAENFCEKKLTLLKTCDCTKIPTFFIIHIFQSLCAPILDITVILDFLNSL